MAEVDRTLRSGRTKIVPGVAGYRQRVIELDEATAEFDLVTIQYVNKRERATEQSARTRRRCRDVTLVGGLVLSLTAASVISGEDLTLPAVTLALLVPAVVLGADAVRVASQRHILDVDAARAFDELALLKIRRQWLVRAARLAPALQRVLARQPRSDVLVRLTNAERKLMVRSADSNYAILRTDLQRETRDSVLIYSTIAAGIAASVNAVVFASLDRRPAVYWCVVIATVFASLASAVARHVTDGRRSRINRVLIWNKQRDMLADADSRLRTEMAELIGDYQDQLVIDLR